MAVRNPLVPTAARRFLTDAEVIFGHRFSNSALLSEALTHRSAVHGRRPAHRKGERRGVGSNERLEFVGDRVLGLLVAEWLIERFPEEQEGELGPRQAQLVSRGVLAAIAEQAGLSRMLDVGRNEAAAGVTSSANVLADAMEASLGALYMDGGLDVARRFVRSAWLPAMDAQLLPPKDAKTALQEWLMARGLALPIYTEHARSGPSHAPEFVIKASGGGADATGVANSKRVAERRAAASLLVLLGKR